MGMVVNSTPLPLYFQERTWLPTVQVAGWAPGPVWTGKEKVRTFYCTALETLFFQPAASRYTDYAIPSSLPVLIVIHTKLYEAAHLVKYKLLPFHP